MIKNKLFHLLVFLCLASTLLSQNNDKTLRQQEIAFENGIYYSFEALQRNQPDIPLGLKSVTGIINPITSIMRISAIKSDAADSLDFERFYAIVVDGVPYRYFARPEATDKLLQVAKIQLIGTICYYAYERYETTKVPIQAYNPANGRPFRRAIMTKRELVFYEKLFPFATGKEVEFTGSEVLNLIADDPQLVSAVKKLSPGSEDYWDKLLRSVEVYNQRHPLRLPEKTD